MTQDDITVAIGEDLIMKLAHILARGLARKHGREGIMIADASANLAEDKAKE